MIPLRNSENLEKFPYSTLALVGIYFVLDLVARLWPGPHQDFLLKVSFYPDQPQKILGALSFLFFPHLFSLLVGALFAWVFTPKLFLRRGIFVSLMIGVSGAALALFSFRFIHPFATSPVLCPEAFLGALLGAFMRRDIWGSVSTVVIGPGWIRVFDVPSYVLLFFWFFYLFLGNLFLEEPFSNAPMLYWLPFISFLWGFGVESIWRENRDSPAQAANPG